VNRRWPWHLAAGGGWALASVALALASGLLRTVLVARVLTPADIGLMGIALLALGFVEAVASTGVDTALVAVRQDVERYIDPAFTIQLTRGIAVMALLWAAAPAIAWAFDNAGATPVIRGVGVIAALRGLANPAVALAIRRLDFRRVFWWSLPEAVVSVCVTVALALTRRDVWALVAGAVAGQAVATITSYGLVPRAPSLSAGRGRIKDLLHFGRFVSGSRALMYFSVYVDAAVVGMTLGTATLGLYQFASRIAELPVVTFTRAVGQVTLPAVSGLHGRADLLRQTWRAMLGSVLAVNGLAAVAIVALAAVAIPAVAGPQWRPAVPLLRVLAVAMLFRALVVLSGQFLDGAGRPALTLRLNAIRLSALLVLLLPLALWDGARGVSVGVLLANAGSALFAVHLAGRVLTSAPVA
jgi:O-antigen/teichoic acid export membrane protein